MRTGRLLLRIVNRTLMIILLLSSSACAEIGEEAWLGYSALDQQAARKYDSLPSTAVLLGDSEVLKTAQQEVIRGVRGMLGRTLRAEHGPLGESSIVLGTFAEIRSLEPSLKAPPDVRKDGYWLARASLRGFDCLLIASPTERGVLYGAFALLSKIARGDNVAALSEVQQPAIPLRWVNQWDNLDGRIERGYGGESIFFDAGKVRGEL